MSFDRERVVREAHEYLILNIVDEVTPVVIDEARGSVIRDVDGREYIDAFSGIAVMNIGYGREEIIQIVNEQIKRYAHVSSYYYYVPIVVELAKRLAEIMPSKRLKKSFFGNSGAEANECAIKLARKYTKRHEIIALAPSFHGRTLGTLSVTGQGGRKRGLGPMLPGVIFVPAPYCYRAPFRYSDEEECGLIYVEIARDIVREASTSEISSFIVEPILGEPGIIPLPKNYLKIFKEEILDKYNALLIVDEVQTGFGRTGRIFGVEYYDIEPDIVTTAKALGGGLPISACTTRDEIASVFEPGDHFSTFGGNPVSAAAAIKTIDIILREELQKKALEKGEYVLKRLRELEERHRLIGDIRGKGLMIGVELVRDEKKTPASQEAKRVKSLMRERGVLVGVGGIYGNVIRIQPPLVISYEQLDHVIRALDESLNIVETQRTL
ncbi:MAG: aspartate aminotransferase family protein [Sulfolobales archaeon]